MIRKKEELKKKHFQSKLLIARAKITALKKSNCIFNVRKLITLYFSFK
jgi:hypothetical protein